MKKKNKFPAKAAGKLTKKAIKINDKHNFIAVFILFFNIIKFDLITYVVVSVFFFYYYLNLEIYYQTL